MLKMSFLRPTLASSPQRQRKLRSHLDPSLGLEVDGKLRRACYTNAGRVSARNHKNEKVGRQKLKRNTCVFELTYEKI